MSTIYLALAAAHNAKRDGSVGKVIATEKEPTKAAEARKHWKQAGEEIAGVIDLRVGDLKDTLKADLGTVDFLLLDSEFRCTFMVYLMVQLIRGSLDSACTAGAEAGSAVYEAWGGYYGRCHAGGRGRV